LSEGDEEHANGDAPNPPPVNLARPHAGLRTVTGP
jgi:hypothetical protein